MARSVKREHEAILASRGGGTESTNLRIARIVEATRSEGPGLRFALWVQGCTLRCQNCCNPEMWPLDEGEVVPVREIATRIEGAAESGVEGISIVGGEPFLQAEAVVAVARYVKSLDLGVIVFTGFEIEALLDDQDENVRRLLETTDLLIDGPYIHERRSSQRRWIGSDNQRMHFLTDRYREHPEIRDDSLQSVHVDFEPGGIVVSGWPSLADALVKTRSDSSK